MNDVGTHSDAPAATPAATLRRRWLERAFASAGIDASHWDPARGVDENRRAIERVYEYYGRLYLDHQQLQWAGMANLIGPSFYAGFQDVGLLPDAVRRLLRRLRRLVRGLLRRDRAVEDLLVGDLGFFETTFLTMQRKIFEDQALMHEAYLGGGIAAIRALGDAGVVDSTTARAWEQIDSGATAEVAAGNRTLLYREQHDVIDRFYDDMRRHSPPSGRLFTFALTLAGSPAVPGAKGYCDVFPLTLFVRLSRRGRLGLRTPLPAGNLALFTNRWRLIEEDTLPAYRRLISERAAEARALVQRSIAGRAGRFRILRRAGRLLLGLVTRWRLALAEVTAKPVRVERVDIDLTTPPTREAAGFDAGCDSRAWANLDRRPFPVTVALPGGRAFAAEAVLVVLSATDLGGRPERLTVKHPPTDLAGAERTLAGLARDWSLDQAEIAAWARRAAAVTTASHAYSTRVFRVCPAGAVRLELQVEHHVEEDTYVLDALFSWDGT